MRARGPGSSLGPGLRVIDHLHRSNVLDVYDAWDDDRGCRVIAKTLRPDRRGDLRARRALIREARLLARLAHPNVVRGYGLVAEPHPVAVLETLTGATVGSLIDDAPLAPAEAAYLGLHLCAGVGYLHRQGWLHLDLKPANVVAEAGRAVVIDLSLARRRAADGSARVRPGTGTWCYAAPEQVRGGRVGPEADVWGIGGLLFEALTGEAAFADDAEAEHPQLEGRAPAVHPAVDACLEPDPDDRPGLTELAAALERVPGATRLDAPRAAPASPVSAPWSATA